MMRTTLLVGLCCALAAPVAAKTSPAVNEFGQFCKTTTSLVPCTFDHTRKIPYLLADENSGVAIGISDFSQNNSWGALPAIHLADSSDSDKSLMTLLQEYIDGLLGKKPAPKTTDKKAAEPGAGEAKTAAPKPSEPVTVTQPAKADIDKALSELLAERESWGTAPAGASTEKAAAPAAPATMAQPAKADIDKSLAALLAERESWGTAPSGATAKSTENKSAPAGNPSLAAAEATGNLSEFITLRESWGTMKPKKVEAPLAKGASSTLKVAKPRKVTGGHTAPVIVNEAELAPAPELSLVSQADIVRARNALFDERASWGTGPSRSTSSVTGDLTAFLQRRERWGTGPAPNKIEAPLAKGAKANFSIAKAAPEATPSAPVTSEKAAEPAPNVSEVASGSIATALKNLLETRSSWGSEPAFSTRRVAGDLSAFLNRRDGWGTGPEPKKIAAPLAKGAKRKLKLAAAPAPVKGSDVIVNPAEDRPLPEVAAIPADQISGAMKALLAERETWGSQPAISGARFAGNLDRYFARRDSWGKGPKAKKIAAPLAKGAKRKLRLAAAPAPVKGSDVIVNPAEDRPLPEVAAIPADQIGVAMKALLAERESWGTAPSVSDARVAGDLTAYLSRRDRWGAAPKPRRIKAPLAKGAPRKLKLAEAPATPADTTPVIVNELEARPLPEMAAIAPGTIKSAMDELFSTRQGWGNEPAISGARFAGDLNRYFARRDGWGKGPKAKKIRAPLAKGAKRRLRLAKAPAVSGNAKPPIINALEPLPIPQLSTIPQGDIANSLHALLKDRESWGEKPTMSAPAANQQVAGASSQAPVSEAERNRCSDDLNALASKRTILFANASAELDSSSNKVLDEIASTIKRCGNVSVRVEGHTDSVGRATSNQALSEARAKSVLDYLVGAGIDRSKLAAIGHGETKPVASNSSSDGRAQNRRIEFTIE